MGRLIQQSQLLELVANTPPVEAEAHHYAYRVALDMAAQRKSVSDMSGAFSLRSSTLAPPTKGCIISVSAVGSHYEYRFLKGIVKAEYISTLKTYPCLT